MKTSKQMPKVISCQGISGDMDLMLLKTSSMQRLHKIREFMTRT